jgi:hypothetical protein
MNRPSSQIMMISVVTLDWAQEIDIRKLALKIVNNSMGRSLMIRIAHSPLCHPHKIIDQIKKRYYEKKCKQPDSRCSRFGN